jgi:hypothetical protein
LWRRVVWYKFADVPEVLAASINKENARMMKAARTSETSVNFYHTTRRYNPEDSRLHIVPKNISLLWFVRDFSNPSPFLLEIILCSLYHMRVSFLF